MAYEILNKMFSSFRWTLNCSFVVVCTYFSRFLSLIFISKRRNGISNLSSYWVCLMCIVDIFSWLAVDATDVLLLNVMQVVFNVVVVHASCQYIHKDPWFSIYRFLPRGNRIFVLHAAYSNPISTTLLGCVPLRSVIHFFLLSSLLLSSDNFCFIFLLCLYRCMR